jgi:cysteine sulfinate desulfinase/cysteine desulfurase-like protein
MGLETQRALGAIRLSLGYDTTAADVDAAAAALAASESAFRLDARAGAVRGRA